MAPRPLVYVGVGFVAGSAWATLSPAIGTTALLLGLLSSLSMPLPRRLRSAAVFLVLGAAWAHVSPRPAPLPPAHIDGTVIGPVHRQGRAIRARVATASGEVRVVLATDGPLRSTDVGIRPCDRVSFRGRVRRGGDEYEVVGKLSAIAVQRSSCWSVWRVADAIHGHLRLSIGDGGGRELVRAMVVGDRSGLREAEVRAFRGAGLSHVLAVSGLHLAVVTALTFLVTRRGFAVFLPAGRPSTAAALAALGVAFVFTLVTGARISTIRAFSMAAVVAIGGVARWRIDAASALAVAAMGMVAAWPALIRDPGFQLSTAATAILVLAAASPVAGSRWRRWLLRGLQASLATTLVTAPIAAAHFGEVAAVGVVVNLLAVPLVEIAVVPVGLAGAVVGLCVPVVGRVLVAAAAWIAEQVSCLAAAASTWVPMVAGPLGWFEGAACIVAGLWVARWWRPGNRLLFALAAALAAVAVAVGGGLRDSHRLRITFVDVGQGDAAVIEFPGSRVWLVDVGPAAYAGPGAVARLLRERGIDEVEQVVISHPHPDHDGALAQLASRVEVRSVWRARAPRWRAGPSPPLGEHTVGDARVVILAPIFDGPRASEDPILSVNDNSIVVLVEFSGRRVLLSGDIEEEAEDRLRAAYPDLGHIDLLKVPHHGSLTSSTPALVDWLRPAFAIISCGRDNRFGHPAPEVVGRWLAAGAEVLRTDRDGDIEVTIDRRGTLVVRTER